MEVKTLNLTELLKMLNEGENVLVIIALAVIFVGGTLGVAAINKGKTDYVSLINELQEQNQVIKGDIATERSTRQAEIKEIKASMGKVNKKFFVSLDFISSLMRHITEERKPPPPEIPEEIKRDFQMLSLKNTDKIIKEEQERYVEESENVFDKLKKLFKII